MTEKASTVELIQELIAEGQGLMPQGGSSYGGYNGELQPQYVSWRHRSVAAIQELGTRAAYILKDLENDKQGAYFFKNSAGRVLGALEAARAIASRHAVTSPTSSTEKSTRSSETAPSSVFVVHGHDHALLEQLARFLEKLTLDPIILFEKPGAGRTIIEKLEQHSDVTAAIVLLTPDDLGRPAGADGEDHPRARQNVVLELGYFLGLLGRDKVTVLYDESVELPSDYRGVEYIKIDSEAAWKLKLARELKHAGMQIDMNRAV